jgi:hypothetical protein
MRLARLTVRQSRNGTNRSETEQKAVQEER